MPPRTTNTLESQAHQALRDFTMARGLTILAERKRRTGMAEMRRPHNAVAIAEFLGKRLDDWQIRTVQAEEHDILLLVTRQGGKGEVTALLALDMLINTPNSTTVITARSDRQARRLLRRIKRFYRQLSNVPDVLVDSAEHFEIANGSEILALPGSEETIRGIDAVDLLLIDEASLVPDELYEAVYPMLAVKNGRAVGMTTPRGKRGWFYKAWVGGESDWHREIITIDQIPLSRITQDFRDRTRRRIGERQWQQEYMCQFLDTDDQLYATELVLAALDRDADTMGLDLPMLGNLED